MSQVVLGQQTITVEDGGRDPTSQLASIEKIGPLFRERLKGRGELGHLDHVTFADGRAIGVVDDGA